MQTNNIVQWLSENGGGGIELRDPGRLEGDGVFITVFVSWVNVYVNLIK